MFLNPWKDKCNVANAVTVNICVVASIAWQSCAFVFQYIVMNSVEERMLTLQEHKRTLMGQAFGLQTQSQEERRRARVRDIKHLIGLWAGNTEIIVLWLGLRKMEIECNWRVWATSGNTEHELIAS